MKFETFNSRYGDGIRLIFSSNEEYNSLINNLEYLEKISGFKEAPIVKILDVMKRYYKEENGIITTIIFDNLWNNIFYSLIDAVSMVEVIEEQDKIITDTKDRITELANKKAPE